MKTNTFEQAGKEVGARTPARAASSSPGRMPEARGGTAFLLKLQRTHGNNFVRGLLRSAAKRANSGCGGSSASGEKCAECCGQEPSTQPLAGYDESLTGQRTRTSDILRQFSLASPAHWVIAASILQNPEIPPAERAVLASSIETVYGEAFLARMLSLAPEGQTQLASMNQCEEDGSCTAATAAGSEADVAQAARDFSELDASTANRLASAIGDGVPLDAATRTEMESLLVSSLDGVRVHADAPAAVLASALGVNAFTIGQDVFFARGHYQPNTAQGRWTLGHELTHVVQQKHSSASGLSEIGQRSADGAAEHEADRAATAISHGLPLLVATRVAATTLQGQRACVTSENLPQNRGGMVNSGGNVSEYFEMNIDWEQPIPTTCECRCGEYRQFVKGHFTVNGVTLTKPLFGGANLEDTVYHEDGDGTWRRYGHRFEAGFGTDVFNNPDRATGCSYRGRDQPGVSGPVGTVVDLSLTFKGQTFDGCNNTFGAIHEWTVSFAGSIA